MASIISLHLNDPDPAKVNRSGKYDGKRPLIRLWRGYPTKVFVMFDHDIIVGSNWFRRYLELGEFVNGNRPPSWRSWRIQPEDILKVTAIEPGQGALSDEYWRFIIQTKTDEHRFAFDSEDGPHVFSFFQQKTPDRLTIRMGEWSHFSWRFINSLRWLVLITLIFFLAYITLSMIVHEDSMVAGERLILISYVLAVLTWFLIGVIPRIRYEAKSSFLEQLHSFSESIWPKIHDPFWISVIGWSLKSVAMAWCVFCIFWIGDQLWFRSLTENASSTSWIYIFLFGPALFLNYWGYRICHAAPKRDRGSETGSEILYLRAFEEDQMITLQPRSWLATSLGVLGSNTPGIKTTEAARFRSPIFLFLNLHPVRFIRMFLNKGADTAEEVIASFFSKFGKVVALGQPYERVPPPGAERVYTEDNPWQQVVTEHLERAKIVIIQPGISSGIRWEIIKTFETVEPQRILLNLAGFWCYPNAFEDFLAILPDHIRVKVPHEIPYLKQPAFLYFDKDWNVRVQLVSYRSPLLWLFLGDAVDLKYTLWPFLQAVTGVIKQSPRPAKRYPVQTVLAWLVVVVLYSLITASILPEYSSAKQFRLPDRSVAKSRETNPLDLLREYSLVEYKGEKVPYTIQLPRYWRQLEVSELPSPPDYLFRREDPFSFIMIISVNRRELPSLASVTDEGFKVFKQKYKKEAGKVRLIDKYKGQNRIAIHFEVRLKTGELIDELLGAYLGKKSTVYLIGSIQNNDSSVINNAYYVNQIKDTFFSIKVND